MSVLHNSLLNSLTSLITFPFNTFIRTLRRALGISVAFDLHIKLSSFWIFEISGNASGEDEGGRAGMASAYTPHWISMAVCCCLKPLQTDSSKQPQWEPTIGVRDGMFENSLLHGLPWWFRWWRVCLQYRRLSFHPWVWKIPWRKEWQPTLVFLPGEFHGQRSWQTTVHGSTEWLTRLPGRE